jgi:curved DNA-binding protein CbpA
MQTSTLPFVNWYEVLGVPPDANDETLRRVYHIVAGRFHPDNTDSGDLDRFLQVKEAFELLSDPKRRKDFDADLARHNQEPIPVFLNREFTDGVQGEHNRRLGVLCLLYNQRKLNPITPVLSVLQLESLMSTPREHLEFAVWYLKQKRLVQADDRSSLTITFDGIDHLEENLPREETVRKLLQPGSPETFARSRTSSSADFARTD